MVYNGPRPSAAREPEGRSPERGEATVGAPAAERGERRTGGRCLPVFEGEYVQKIVAEASTPLSAAVDEVKRRETRTNAFACVSQTIQLSRSATFVHTEPKRVQNDGNEGCSLAYLIA